MTDTTEKQSAADSFSAPDWLADAGLELWHTLAPDLRRKNLVRDSDRIALARYCDHVARWLKLRDKVAARGESYETKSRHGKMQRLNPDFVAMERVENRMDKLEEKFGLTPDARFSILKDRAAAPGDLPFDQPQQSTKQDSESAFDELLH